MDATDLFNIVIAKDDARKVTQQRSDELLAKGNQLAKQIAELYKNGKVDEANALKGDSLSIKDQSKALQTKQSELEQEIQDILQVQEKQEIQEIEEKQQEIQEIQQIHQI